MDLTGFITRRKAITLVAEFAEGSEFAGGIAGFAVAQPIRKIGRILTLDIVPEARRFGLATRLMQECEKRLRACGCEQVYLETAVNNEPALLLYHKLGLRDSAQVAAVLSHPRARCVSDGKGCCSCASVILMPIL